MTWSASCIISTVISWSSRERAPPHARRSVADAHVLQGVQPPLEGSGHRAVSSGELFVKGDGLYCRLILSNFDPCSKHGQIGKFICNSNVFIPIRHVFIVGEFIFNVYST